MCKTRLNPGGIIVTQSGPGGELSIDEVFLFVHTTLSRVFENVQGCFFMVPSFFNTWTCCIASDSDIEAFLNKTNVEDVDKMIEERIVGGSAVLKYYDGIVQSSITTCVGKTQRNKVKEALDDPKYIITEANRKNLVMVA